MEQPQLLLQRLVATVGGRKPDRLEIVLHHGAKVRPDTTLQATIKDPGKLLKWAAPDRAIITCTADDSTANFRSSLKKIIKQWVVYHKTLEN